MLRCVFAAWDWNTPISKATKIKTNFLSWDLSLQTTASNPNEIVLVPKIVLYDDHLNTILTQEARQAER